MGDVSSIGARDLLGLAQMWLAQHYPDSLIVPEFSIGNWGSALIDVAAITPTEIIGIEIKGAGDSHTRLALQAAVYSKAATRMFVVACPTIEQKIFRFSSPDWGRLRVDGDTLVRAEPSAYQRNREPAFLCTAPRQLLQSLWRNELYQIAARNGIIVGKRATADALLEAISEGIPLKVIRTEVCEALRTRRAWDKKFVWAKFLNAMSAQVAARA